MMRRILSNHYALISLVIFLFGLSIRAILHFEFPYLWFDEVILKQLIQETPFYEFLIPGFKNHLVGGQPLFFLLIDIFWSIFQFNLHTFFILNLFLYSGITLLINQLLIRYKTSYLLAIFINLFLATNIYLIQYTLETKHYLLEFFLVLYVLIRNNSKLYEFILMPFLSLPATAVLFLKSIFEKKLKETMVVLISLAAFYISLRINDPVRLKHFNYFWFELIDGQINISNIISYIKGWASLWGHEISFVTSLVFILVLIQTLKNRSRENILLLSIPILFFILSSLKLYPLQAFVSFNYIDGRVNLFLIPVMLILLIKTSFIERLPNLLFNTFILFIIIFQFIALPKNIKLNWTLQSQINDQYLFAKKMMNKYQFKQICSNEKYFVLLKDEYPSLEWINISDVNKYQSDCFFFSETIHVDQIEKDFSQFELKNIENSKFNVLGILKRKN